MNGEQNRPRIQPAALPASLAVRPRDRRGLPIPLRTVHTYRYGADGRVDPVPTTRHGSRARAARLSAETLKHPIENP